MIQFRNEPKITLHVSACHKTCWEFFLSFPVQLFLFSPLSKQRIRINDVKIYSISNEIREDFSFLYIFLSSDVSIVRLIESRSKNKLLHFWRLLPLSRNEFVWIKFTFAISLQFWEQCELCSSKSWRTKSGNRTKWKLTARGKNAIILVLSVKPSFIRILFYRLLFLSLAGVFIAV